MPSSRAEGVHRLDQAGFDRRDQRRMRVERPVPADLALQAERLAVGRQQQFDRRGVEADAVVEALHLVLGVDALDGHHRHQHLDLGDLRRVAGEQRLDVVRPSALCTTKSTQSPGMSTRGSLRCRRSR